MCRKLSIAVLLSSLLVIVFLVAYGCGVAPVSTSLTTQTSAVTPQTGIGTTPSNPVPLSRPLEIYVPWESGKAKITVLESRDGVDDSYTTTRYVTIRMDLAAVGNAGGIFPYYPFEFMLVGSEGKIYERNNFSKMEVLSGYSNTKEIKFYNIYQNDSNFLLIFQVLPLSGPAMSYFFALK